MCYSTNCGSADSLGPQRPHGMCLGFLWLPESCDLWTQEAMPPEEVLAAARGGGRAGATAGDAFASGLSLPRAALLGAQRSVVALLRAGRGPGSAVYELVLTA